MNYFYLFTTICFTVYGQLILKWQVSAAGALPAAQPDKLLFLLRLLINPWVISAFIAAFIAALSWMAAMTKFEISYAYPFISLSFILVLVLSGILFNEAITVYKIIGLALIVAGIFVGSRG